jgi:hypothetical protein
MSARRVIGPIFYDDTFNAVRNVNNILRPVISELKKEERPYGAFQQDSATTHTAHVSVEALREVLYDGVISRGLWPPRSLI